ncbi:hypothetical protein CC79DRAFT_1364039 [Sarocladium strictum]
MEKQAAPKAPRDPIPMVLKPAPASSTHTTHSTRTSRNEVLVVLPENVQQPDVVRIDTQAVAQPFLDPAFARGIA